MSDLICHWPLAVDVLNRVGSETPSTPTDVELGHIGPHGQPDSAAAFNGRSSRIDVANHPSLDLGHDDFAITAWVNSDCDVDVAGSILSKYDPCTRRGMHLYVSTNDGMTSAALANSRQLSFGIDDARADQVWTECGRPGNAVKIDTLAVVNEVLYATTLETGADEHGQLWRYAGGQDWVPLGNPVGCNIVSGAVEFNGELYCAFGRYVVAGSCLGEILNGTPGGQIYRRTVDGQWIFCGHPGKEIGVPDDQDTGEYNIDKADDATALNVWNGSLYAISHHLPGVWRYDGGTEWRCIGPDSRVMTTTVFQGRFYALLNGGPVFRYEGDDQWTDCGLPEASTQTYGAATMRGELYVGTWPTGEVFRYDGERSWEKLGRLGYEMEVMGMAMYNGKLYAGSLPMANVWRLDENGALRPGSGSTTDVEFTLMANLDDTPVKLRRAWSMAIHDGRLYAGTLPGGRVFSFEAGKMATWDKRFPGGWHHVAAVREHRLLKLYVDGVLRACSTSFYPGDFDLNNGCPLSIGFGADTHFAGLMSDVRLYRGALDHAEIVDLARTDET